MAPVWSVTPGSSHKAGYCLHDKVINSLSSEKSANIKGKNKDCQVSVHQIFNTAFFFPLFTSSGLADQDIYQSQAQCLIKSCHLCHSSQLSATFRRSRSMKFHRNFHIYSL